MKTRSQIKKIYIQPVTKTFEFFGPHGTIVTVLCLPLVVLGLFLLCNQDVCTVTALEWDYVKLRFLYANYWNEEAFYAYVGWILFQFTLAIILPGRVVEGTPLPSPSAERLKYKINGLLSCFTSCLLFAYLTFQFGSAPWIWIADHYMQLASAGIFFASSLSLALYMWSFRSSRVIVAKGGNSGYPIYDFWMGRELNPGREFLGLDLKFICELRPGLIGWVILNTSLAVKQYSLIHRLTNSMILVNITQGYYVFDALWNEQAILTTMDITTDGFGFMLVFGDLVWVPFTYSLQARYLSIHPKDLSFPFLLFCISLNLLGLYIFRSANSEKNAFRSDPNSSAVAHLKYLKTESGSKLLISGWWGTARKINYTGDWLIALAWCLTTGFYSLIPYFYAIYFVILLIHRAERDDEICAVKYGKDWIRYKKLIKYRFVPGIL